MEPPADEPLSPGEAEQTAQEAAEAANIYNLTLQEAIERALRSNLDIAVRKLSPGIVGSTVTREESLFDSSFEVIVSAEEQSNPSVSSLGGADIVVDERRYLETSYIDPLPTGGRYRLTLRSLRTETNSLFSTVNPSFDSEWEIAFTQPLFKNFGLDANRTRIVVARNNHQISKSDFRQTVLDILALVEQAYWELAFRILDLEVKNQALDLARDLLRLNRTKVQVGTLAPIEITQAEAGVADREEGVIVAQNEIRNAEDRLRQLLGRPGDPLWGLTLRPMDAPPFDETLPELDASLALAMSHRPDLERMRLALSSREAEFALARNLRRPDLVFDAAYGARGLDGEFRDCVDASGNSLGFIDDVFFTDADCTGALGTRMDVSNGFSDAFRQARERDADFWTTGLTLRVPVGNRDARGRYIGARLAREQAEIELKLLEQNATVEVRRAVRQIETDIKRVRAARVNSRLQKEKLEAEQKKFENGISTSFNVLEFQEDLAQARSRENLALVDYNKSRAELQRVLGTLPEHGAIALEE
jgi:outer membrane protein TolC